jgi:S-methylmethionine-dependent homocysteine/selenocysteine methylase
MKQILNNHKIILTEGAVIERLRRSDKLTLHPRLVNTPLIYDPAGKMALAEIYQDYMDIALEAKYPFLMCAPTWRASHDRVLESKAKLSINGDAVGFMQTLRSHQRSGQDTIKIGGLVGCKNDCYKPDEGLSALESEDFHSWQIEQLAGAGVDFLMAQTLPNVQEAKGIARAMERTGIPYIISFVISREGNILDGTDLTTAMDFIDSGTGNNPLGFMVNCAYPTFLCPEKQPASLFDRFIGFQANASSLDHCDLDNSDRLEQEDVSDWGDAMLALNESYGVKILGGCCGTAGAHLRYIVDHIDG